MREGPILTDENGELDTPYLSCRGCKHVRVHDFHYFFCADIDSGGDHYATGRAKQIYGYPRPHPRCRFLETTQRAPDLSRDTLPDRSTPSERQAFRDGYGLGVQYATHRVRGFMCKIDFDHELGAASSGSTVYPSLRALRREHTMADACGIVEVEVTLVRVVAWDRVGERKGETDGG